jgi:hypothetical protein
MESIARSLIRTPHLDDDEGALATRAPNAKRAESTAKPQSKPKPKPDKPPPSTQSIPLVVQSQGATNACGTTSLASILSYWGRPTDHRTIDSVIRHFDLFTAPDNIVSYARSQGMRAHLKNGASLEDIGKMVAQGAPPMVLFDIDGSSNANLHYVAVCGVKRDSTGNISSLDLADSATGRRRTLSAAEFEDQWSSLRLHDAGTGLDRVMISIAPDDDRSVRGADGTTRKAHDIQFPAPNPWGDIQSFFTRVVAQSISSVTNAVGSLLSDIGQGLARGIKNVLGALFG